MLFAHNKTWLRLLPVQIDIMLSGLVVQHSHLFPHLSPNGSLKTSTKKTVLKSF